MKVCLIYRDNDLFEQYVDLLLQGHEVLAKYVIPRGETYSDHEARVRDTVANALSQQAEVLVTDRTCSDADESHQLKIQVNLDDVFAQLIRKRNPNYTVEENFAWYADQVVQGRAVKKVVVVQDHIADHSFAGSNNSPRREKVLAWIIAQLQELFPVVPIQLIATLDKVRQHANDPEALVVLDRHCGIKDIMPRSEGWYWAARNWPYRSLLYTLPFETCAQHLASRGQAGAFSIEELRQAFQAEVNWNIRMME